MTQTISSYFLTDKNAKLLLFGSSNHFNGAFGESVRDCCISRDFTNSCQTTIYKRNENPIDVFKLTNQSVLTWDDHWVDLKTNKIVDPKMRVLNLQRNSLLYVNINVKRDYLEELNLEGNSTLQKLHIHKTPNLSTLILDGCTSLNTVSLGENKSIVKLSAKGCNLSSGCLEQLLRDFRPVISNTKPVTGVGLFRKVSSTLLDLRGNSIDWSNRNIASKIRLLLTNNWEVRWDNPPPTEVVPLRMYTFPVESNIALS
jgi:hypothetical protein